MKKLILALGLVTVLFTSCENEPLEFGECREVVTISKGPELSENDPRRWWGAYDSKGNRIAYKLQILQPFHTGETICND